MPRGDRTGPMGFGPMTGRRAGYCAGSGMAGFMNLVGGQGGWGRGWRHWFYATGLPGWARAGWGLRAWGAAPYPSATPVGAAEAGQAEVEALKAQVEHYEKALEAMRRQLQKLEGEGKTE